MRRCLVRRQSETSGGAFGRFWQHFRSVSFKGRFRRHLASHCAVKANSLASDISPFLPESEEGDASGLGIFQARLAFTMAAFNVLVQWHGLEPYASGFVPLSIAEFSL